MQKVECVRCNGTGKVCSIDGKCPPDTTECGGDCYFVRCPVCNGTKVTYKRCSGTSKQWGLLQSME